MCGNQAKQAEDLKVEAAGGDSSDNSGAAGAAAAAAAGPAPVVKMEVKPAPAQTEV